LGSNNTDYQLRLALLPMHSLCNRFRMLIIPLLHVAVRNSHRVRLPINMQRFYHI
jgi:hypothetical protein